jgi:hypothetical protein
MPQIHVFCDDQTANESIPGRHARGNRGRVRRPTVPAELALLPTSTCPPATFHNFLEFLLGGLNSGNPGPMANMFGRHQVEETKWKILCSLHT